MSKLNGKYITQNCLMSFAVVAAMESMLTSIFIMVNIFAITFQKINSLEEG